jgi:hypothetical protein
MADAGRDPRRMTQKKSRKLQVKMLPHLKRKKLNKDHLSLREANSHWP